MNDSRNNKQDALHQLIKNVGAAGAGSAIGYFGAGTGMKKLLGSTKVQNKLNSLSPTERTKLLGKLKTLSGLTSTTAAGLSSIAIHNALTKGKEPDEKLASLCTRILLNE